MYEKPKDNQPPSIVCIQVIWKLCFLFSDLSMVLHFDNRNTEKLCSKHRFTFCSSLQGLVFLSECKTIELRLLSAAKWGRKKKSKSWNPLWVWSEKSSRSQIHHPIIRMDVVFGCVNNKHCLVFQMHRCECSDIHFSATFSRALETEIGSLCNFYHVFTIIV